MNSVERVKTYSEEVPQEDDENDRLIDPATLPESWPAQGNVEAAGVELAYRDGPLVLKGVSFKIAASEKIGIAGRTGSGK
jgi:ABC-type multidrug transport system fused ATPase/permease subunit